MADLIVAEVLTSQSLQDQKEDKHPLLVLSVEQNIYKITVTNAGTLLKVGLKRNTFKNLLNGPTNQRKSHARFLSAIKPHVLA